MIDVSAVPNDSRSRNDDVSPGNRTCASVEKKNAERPKPESTIPVVVARYGRVSSRFRMKLHKDVQLCRGKTLQWS